MIEWWSHYVTLYCLRTFRVTWLQYNEQIPLNSRHTVEWPAQCAARLLGNVRVIILPVSREKHSPWRFAFCLSMKSSYLFRQGQTNVR